MGGHWPQVGIAGNGAAAPAAEAAIAMARSASRLALDRSQEIAAGRMRATRSPLRIGRIVPVGDEDSWFMLGCVSPPRPGRGGLDGATAPRNSNVRCGSLIRR